MLLTVAIQAPRSSCLVRPALQASKKMDIKHTLHSKNILDTFLIWEMKKFLIITEKYSRYGTELFVLGIEEKVFENKSGEREVCGNKSGKLEWEEETMRKRTRKRERGGVGE